LDKKRWAGKKALSAHLFLWICRRFSTGGRFFHVFEHPATGLPRSAFKKKDQRAGSMQSSAVWQGVVSSAACAGGAVGQPDFL